MVLLSFDILNGVFAPYTFFIIVFSFSLLFLFWLWLWAFEGFGLPANDGVGYLITPCWDYGGQVRSNQAYNKPRPKPSKRNFDSGNLERYARYQLVAGFLSRLNGRLIVGRSGRERFCFGESFVMS